MMRSIIHGFSLLSFLFFCACNSSTKDKGEAKDMARKNNLKWSATVDEMLRDTLRVNEAVDSLKKQVLLAQTDTEAINYLNELAQNWKNDPNRILALEAINKSRELGYAYGELDGRSRLGYYYYWIDNYAKADSLLQQVLLASQKSGFVKIELLALTSLGKVARITGDLDKGLEYFQRALKIATAARDKNQIAFCLNCIGEVYRLKGNYGEALAYFQRSLDASRQAGDRNRIGASLSSLADIYRLQDNYGKALELYQEAYELAGKTGDKPLTAFCLNGLGEVYRVQGSYGKAIKYFQEAERMARAMGDKTRIVSCLSSIGDCYRSLGSFSRALDYFNECIKTCDEIGDQSNKAFSLNGIGDIYLSRNNRPQALRYFKEALEIARGMEDKTLVAECINSLGNLYFDMGDIALARQFAEEGMPAAKECNTPKVIENAANLLYKIHEKDGNYKKALEMYSLSITMKDSVVNEATLQKFAAHEFKVKETEMKAAQLKKEIGYKTEQVKKEAELKQQKLVRNGFIVGAILMVVLVFFIYRNLQQSKKATRIIAEQKRQVEIQKAITEQQKQLVEEKQKEIVDSIRYAKNIQQTLFPTEKYIERTLKRLQDQQTATK